MRQSKGGDMIEAVTRADTPVESPLPRGFRISDGMILLAGGALALASGSHLYPLLADTLGRLGRVAAAHRADLAANRSAFWRVVNGPLRNTLWYGIQVAETFVLGMTPAFLVVRLRRPRPPLRALPRQPGTVAGLAIVLGLIWGTGGLLWLLPDKVDSMTAAPIAVGGAVAVGWIALAVSRRSKPEAGWVDRTGRVLGCAAIGTALLGLIVFRV